MKSKIKFHFGGASIFTGNVVLLEVRGRNKRKQKLLGSGLG